MEQEDVETTVSFLAEDKAVSAGSQPSGSAVPERSEKVRYPNTERVRQLFNIID